MVDDLDQLMAELGAAQVPGRTPKDRFRDFRETFLGSDTGKRVLHDILAWGHIWNSSIVRDNNTLRADPYMIFAKEGERNLALKILTALHKQPRPDRPTTQRKSEGE